MPVWKENMTQEDFERNRTEYKNSELARAQRLRRKAKEMLDEADKIEELWKKK